MPIGPEDVLPLALEVEELPELPELELALELLDTLAVTGLFGVLLGPVPGAVGPV